MIKKEPHWYTINMLPLYIEMIETMLTETKTDLEMLNNIKIESPYLSKEKISLILNKYNEQRNNNWIFFEQCKRWRNDTPDDEELRLIARIESVANLLDINIHKIIGLIENINRSIIV